MKVLTVLTYYHPHWTGLTAYARRLAEGLVQRGHQVTVLTSRYRPELAKGELFKGVRIVRLERILRVSRGVIMPSFPWVANRLIREHDVVQMHTPLMESPLITTLARWHGKRVLFTHHGDLVMPAGPFNQFVQFTVTGLMTLALKGSARVSVASKDYADSSRFLRPFQDKLAYIYPAMEIPAPIPAQVAAWRRELGGEDASLIGFAGRFVEEKGFDFLLKSIPYVLQRVPNARFVYAGDHEVVYESFYEKWEHLIRKWPDHVIQVGLIRDPQKMANWYALCDVFALPSRSDSFGIVQVEAMLSGTPVVATDIPGGRVPVQETGMGLLVRPQDERALADGLVEVLKNRAPYVKNRAAIRSVFNLERTLDQYELLLQSLI